MERIIDLAYQDWLKQAGKEQAKRKHPSREEYGVLFRQMFPWAGAVALVTQGDIDTQLLDWLEKAGGDLVNDDAGRWAIAEGGMQPMPDDSPIDMSILLTVNKNDWRSSVREAIKAAIEENGGVNG